MHRRVRTRARLRPLVGALLSLVLATCLAGGTLLAPTAASATTTREARLIARINQARVAHGLPRLHVKPGLVRYARSHSRAMAARDVLFHTADFDVICCWRAIGENVGLAGSVWSVHRAFMHSAGHRANVLSRSYRQVGVGIVVRAGRLWVTEVFRRPS